MELPCKNVRVGGCYLQDFIKTHYVLYYINIKNLLNALEKLDMLSIDENLYLSTKG